MKNEAPNPLNLNDKLLRVKFIWGELEVIEPKIVTIKMIYFAPHEYSHPVYSLYVSLSVLILGCHMN